MNMQSNFYVIAGLGATGLSCARYLSKKNIPFVIADTRQQPPQLLTCQKEFPNVKIHLGKFSDNIFLKATKIIVSPGVSLQESVIQTCIANHLPVISDIELFAQEAKAPIIAITGSNGKSTLVTLMGELIQQAGLKAIVCGNIGFPVLDALLLPAPDYYVVELSSFQLESTFSLHAKIAVVLNISPDHLDRHPTEQHYLDAKKRIYQRCEFALVNADEPHIWRDLSFAMPPIRFTLHEPRENEWGLREIQQDIFLAHGSQNIVNTKEIALQGRHQYQNVLVALAMGTLLKLPLKNMLETLKNFKGLAHRCQLVHEQRGVRWYDDSKATNVGAAIAAIQSIGKQSREKIILIAGGDSKEVALHDLREPVKQYVSHAILFGKDADKLATTLFHDTNIIRVPNMQAAVQEAAKLTKSGGVVLLAPACSSLDMYASYAERGDDFAKNIKTLI